jgi:hypothetical protein
VPDGDSRPGVQLTLANGNGGMLDLAWGASCLAGDGQYEIYEGSLGSFASHVPATCSTGGLTSASITPASGNRYYVVVPANTSHEGSYGLDGLGAERPVSSAPCLPQNMDDPVCP